MTSDSRTRSQDRENMRNCAECGMEARPGQSFCDGCGAVLSWTPQAGSAADRADRAPEGAPAPAAEPATVPVPAPAAASPAPASGTAAPPRPPAPDPATRLGDPAASGAPSGGHGGADDPDTEELEPVVTGGAPIAPGAAPSVPPGAAPGPAPVPDTVPVPVPDTDADTDAAARARALLVPVAEPEPRAPRQPEITPVLPGRPEAARPRVPGPLQDEVYGGIACRWCGVANPPERYFCRRCAMRMAPEPEPGPDRRSWWRRLFSPHGSEEAPWAGDRPRLRRGIWRWLRWVGWGLVAALIIGVAFTIGPAFDATKDHFIKRAPVLPQSAKASRSFPGHQPELVFDRFSNTYWGPGITGTGEGEWIEAHFEEPVELLDIMITPGVSKRSQKLHESSVPHELDALITTSDGRTRTKTLYLDQGGVQRRAFRVDQVTSVRFTIRSTYGATDDKQVAIAEIEFYGPTNQLLDPNGGRPRLR